MAADKAIVIKGSDKGSSVTFWDRSDCLHETPRQLEVQNIYEDVKFSGNVLTNLAEKRNRKFKSFKKTTNLGKLFLRYSKVKILKLLSAVLVRPVTSNYGTPTEKVSEYLDYVLKLIMQDSWSYIKVSGDYLKKIKNIGKIQEGAVAVTADFVRLSPSISHDAGLEALQKGVSERDSLRCLLRIQYG